MLKRHRTADAALIHPVVRQPYAAGNHIGAPGWSWAGVGAEVKGGIAARGDALAPGWRWV